MINSMSSHNSYREQHHPVHEDCPVDFCTETADYVQRGYQKGRMTPQMARCHVGESDRQPGRQRIGCFGLWMYLLEMVVVVVVVVAVVAVAAEEE